MELIRMENVDVERIRRIVDHAQSEILELNDLTAQGVVAKFALQQIEDELGDEEEEEDGAV